MSALFSKRKEKSSHTASKIGKTFLVVDIENGSVATALAHTSQGEAPKLFAEKRVQLPISQSVSSERLARQLGRALEEALTHTTEVASLVRSNSETASMGDITGSAVFFGAPWATLTRGDGRLRWEFEPEFLSQVEHTVESRTAPHLIQFHPFGRAVAHTTQKMMSGTVLTCIVTGEVAELVLTEGGRVIGRATVPIGAHTLVRTLQSHAGATVPEAHSALRLATQADAYPFPEAFDAAASTYAEHFSDAARDLLQNVRTDTVLIVAPSNISSWLARALSQRVNATELFPHGGAIRALRPHHLVSHVTIHPNTDDVPLMLEAMFINDMPRSSGASV